MATIREIRTQWSIPSGVNTYSVMYFEGGISVASQRTALDDFWDSVTNFCVPGVTATIESAGKEIDDATGTLVGTWSSGTPLPNTGASSAEPIPDVAQGLIQWRTSTVVNGRFLRGRTFVPGLAGTLLDNGNLNNTVISNWQVNANDLIATGAGLVVWHRPISGSGGSHTAVSTASIWPELAYLRRRRN